jgi:hypothetical protein
MRSLWNAGGRVVDSGQRRCPGKSLMQVKLAKDDCWQIANAAEAATRGVQVMSNHVQLKKVVLHLARTKEFPEGSIRHGYELIAPLDKDGHVDANSWQDHRNACVVRRFWGNEPRMRGMLVHRAGGVQGATWVFDYDRARDNDDEAGYRLGEHVFVPGEYVSIHDAEGHTHTFKVATVEPA